MKTSPPKIERLTKRHAGQTYPLDSAEKPPIFKKQADWVKIARKISFTNEL